MRNAARLALALLVGALVAAAGFWWWFLHTPAVPMPVLAGEFERGSLDEGGRPRTYGVYLPPRRAHPAPLVFVLHGSFGTGERMRSDTAFAFDALADEHGFIVVYPDGVGRAWNDCRATGGGEAKREQVDDVAFLRALYRRLAAEYPVDGRRVFAAGISNGGQMALRLALEAPDLVLGVAAVAAGLPAAGNMDCRASGEARAVLLIDGTDDPVNPYQGGEVSWLGPIGRRGRVESAEASIAYWRELAGYGAGPFEHRYPDADPEDGTVATRQVWSGEGRPEVALITIHGGGHSFPDPVKSAPRLLGRTSHDVPAAAEIWRFFARQNPGPGEGAVNAPPSGQP